MLNISRSKSNLTMKFSQFIEYNMTNVFLQKACKKRGRRLIPDLFFVFFVCFFFKKHSITSKQVVSNIVLIYLGGPPHEHTIKSNCITSQTVDPEIFSISILYNRVWYWLHHHILCMIFQEKYFLWDILLPD